MKFYIGLPLNIVFVKNNEFCCVQIKKIMKKTLNSKAARFWIDFYGIKFCI
jgi:hypothetical protein